MLTAASCGPFDEPFSPNFVAVETRGEARWSLSLGGSQPSRRRFQVRIFNHFLHPRAQIQTRVELLGVEGDIPELFVAGSVALGPTQSFQHLLEDELAIEVEASRASTLTLEVDSVHLDAGAAERAGGSTLEVVATEVEPKELVVAAPLDPLFEGPRRPFPSGEPSCGPGRNPVPILPTQPALPFTLEGLDAAWLVLAGHGFDSTTQVQFSTPHAPVVEAIEIQALDPGRIRVRAPILWRGPVDLRVRTSSQAGRLAGLAWITERSLTPGPPPPLDAVRAAVDDGLRRFVASSEAVLEVTSEGYRPGPSFPYPPGQIQSLLLSRARPGELWAGTSRGLFRAHPDGDFEAVVGGSYRTIREPRPELIAAGGRPTLALAFGAGASLRTWDSGAALEGLLFSSTPQDQPAAFGVSGGAVVVSLDGGRRRWKAQWTADVRDLASHPRDCRSYLALGVRSVYMSNDGGSEWSEEPRTVERVVASDSRVFALGEGVIWEWSPGPWTWTDVVRVPENFQVEAWSVSPDGRRMDLYGTTGRYVLEARWDPSPG